MKKILLTSLLVLSLLCSAGCGEQTEEPEMSLLAINVRKADALLLRCGQSAYLIDTGIKKNSDTLLDALRKEGITKLTGVILTHTHADHTGGLKALLQSGNKAPEDISRAEMNPDRLLRRQAQSR